jgi:hypothetical protein
MHINRGIKVLAVLSCCLVFFSCGGSHSEKEGKTKTSAGTKQNGNVTPSTSVSPSSPTDTYAPRQVIVRFRPNTEQEAIETIKRTLHLDTLKIISPPDLLLMEIKNDTPVEETVSRLREFEAVRLAEPNYARSVR